MDFDYAGYLDETRSLIIFVVFGYSISWKETSQYIVAFSTNEAKYMALLKAIIESIWVYGLCRLNLHVSIVHCDNQRTIHLARNKSTMKGLSTLILNFTLSEEVSVMAQLAFKG